jgi:hypothetical protein
MRLLHNPQHRFKSVLIGHARFRLRAAAGLSAFLASCLAARLPLIGNTPPSHQFLRHTLNSRLVVVKNGLLAATIPFDGYARPILFNDGALIGWIVLPANAVEWLEKSGLVAGHFIEQSLNEKSTLTPQKPNIA